MDGEEATDEPYQPVRLDTYLHKLNPQTSRAQLQRLIKENRAQVNGETQTKTGFMIKYADKVKLDFDFEQNANLPDITIPVLYEDDDCVVIDKSLGVLVHSKGAFNPEATVASWLAARPQFDFPLQDGNQRAGIVHRLDRATGGVMICAKNQTALTHLQKQFQDRKAKKTYTARIEGQIEPPKALVDLPIERNPKQPQRFRVGQNGKSSQTYYEILQNIEQKNKIDCLVELKPMTGRTHQLRVHLAYLKHPIIGDTFYDGRAAKRLYLHASELTVTLPNKNRTTFKSDVPEEFYTSNI